jgi:GTP cyclohydrolase I
MKPNETLLSTLSGTDASLVDDLLIDRMGDDHEASAAETPLRPDAFDLSDAEKIARIEAHFREIMHTLGMDLSDDSLKGTPRRVAKMFVKETFSGLNPANKPSITLFENKYKYSEMLVEKDITFFSNCEHHFVPIWGKAHVAYISNGNVIGLSKLNRLVQYFAKRPQVQERLTMQIALELVQVLGTEDVAVIMDANHMCVASRGINDVTSSTVTSYYGGRFKESTTREELLKYIGKI